MLWWQWTFITKGQHLNPKKHCFSFILGLQLLFRLTLKTCLLFLYLTKDYMQVCFREILHLHLTDSITLDSIFYMLYKYIHLHIWSIKTEPREYPIVFSSMACLRFQAWRTQYSVLTLDFCMWQTVWVFSITGSLGFTKPSSSSLYLVFYYFVRTMQVFHFWRLYILFS